jgi:hypothetical protein
MMAYQTLAQSPSKTRHAAGAKSRQIKVPTTACAVSAYYDPENEQLLMFGSNLQMALCIRTDPVD